jgi:DNA-binding NarL/FixJ family response regulator
MHEKLPNRAVLGVRQMEILVYAALGYSYEQTANALGISINTVKNSLRRIIEKLDASSRSHAVTMALRQGLLDLGTLKELAVTKQFIEFPKESDLASEHESLFEQIVRYVAQGYLNKEISQALGISEQCVKNCIFSITKKLGARNRAHLIIVALLNGLLDLQSLTEEPVTE